MTARQPYQDSLNGRRLSSQYARLAAEPIAHALSQALRVTLRVLPAGPSGRSSLRRTSEMEMPPSRTRYGFKQGVAYLISATFHRQDLSLPIEFVTMDPSFFSGHVW